MKQRELESGILMEEADDGNGLVLRMIGTPTAVLDLTEHEVAELRDALGLWLAGVMWWVGQSVPQPDQDTTSETEAVRRLG